MNKKIFFILLSVFVAVSVSAQSYNVYLSPKGNDNNDGTTQFPIKTLERAMQLIRPYCGKKSVNVMFDDGIYYLSSPLVFRPYMSGTRQYPVTFQSLHPQRAVISGGKQLKLNWKYSSGNGFYVAKVKGNDTIDQLFVNGRRQRMARYPNVSSQSDCNVFDHWKLSESNPKDSAVDALSPLRTTKWKNPAEGYVHAMHKFLWGDMHWQIKGKKADGTLNMEGGWQNNRPAPMHPVFRFVENIKEELDEPEEWYYDRSAHLLYYMPSSGTDMRTALIEIATQKNLIRYEGSSASTVHDIHIRGFIFRHTSRTFMENKERLLRSDWTIYRGGAIEYEGAKDCSIMNCDFDQLGGNTVFVNKYNRNITISDCYIHESGANGIAFVGDTASVRNPLFDVGKTHVVLRDLIFGPRTDNYPANCTVSNCILTQTGRYEKQTAPIEISMSANIHVDHCSIYDVPRAGINISEGTFGGNVIENCDIFNTVLETGDHGSFNSWGRDRYWMPNSKAVSDSVEAHPSRELLDMTGKNILRHNRWRCDHGWDIDLDDGSSNYLICDNLLLHGGLKLREGYHRVVLNNVIVNNSLHPHVWFRKSGDIVKHNIFCGAYRPAAMTCVLKSDEKWGLCVDSNFFATTKSDMLKFAINDCDSHSQCGNPLFVSPAEGNYDVSSSSGALTVGFHHFSMSSFGVTTSRLKSIVKTPALPDYEFHIVAAKNEKNVAIWHDAKLTSLTGNALSAYGMDLDACCLLVECPESGYVSKIGVMSGDLIISINGKNVSSHAPFDEIGADKLIKKITVMRNQKEIEIKILSR